MRPESFLVYQDVAEPVGPLPLPFVSSAKGVD